MASALRIFWSWSYVPVRFASSVALANCGTTIAARIPRMMTTISTSTSVKARASLLFIATSPLLRQVPAHTSLGLRPARASRRESVGHSIQLRNTRGQHVVDLVEVGRADRAGREVVVPAGVRRRRRGNH